MYQVLAPAQEYKLGYDRILKVKPGGYVTVAGVIYYTNLFNFQFMKSFSREIYIPPNANVILIE